MKMHASRVRSFIGANTNAELPSRIARSFDNPEPLRKTLAVDGDLLPRWAPAIRCAVPLQRRESFQELRGGSQLLRVQARADAGGERDRLRGMAARVGRECRPRLPAGGR